ncbi:unnamed protein product [Ilex paraguariensis]|uniref:Uncharacterized protein n=1 Tax=Ilex paraguariensis TaxID=185542 RepID=A0ABC8SFV9_9AQUA
MISKKRDNLTTVASGNKKEEDEVVVSKKSLRDKEKEIAEGGTKLAMETIRYTVDLTEKGKANQATMEATEGIDLAKES